MNTTQGKRLDPEVFRLPVECLFAHLETVYLGCLSRRSLVMRNVRDAVAAAQGKPILFFPARHDHWLAITPTS
jgi:nicotinate phosphoribosyltransferase